MTHSLRVRAIPLVFFGVCCLLMAGCGKIPTWGELTGQNQAPPAPVVPIAPVPPVQQPVPEALPPVDPAAELAKFQALPPQQINDVTLAQLAAVDGARENLTEIIADGSPLTNTGLSVLERFPSLKTLDVGGTQIDEAAAEAIGRATSLEKLVVPGAGFSDTGLSRMRGLSQLKELYISRAQLTENGFAEIAEHPLLEILSVCETRVSDESLRMICGLPHLKQLHMSGANLSEEGLAALANVQGLEALTISDCNLQLSALPGIVKSGALDNLKYLNVSRNPLSLPAAKAISQLKNLETLSISGAGGDDQGISMVIGGMTKLKNLFIGVNPCSNNVMKAVAKLPNLEVLAIFDQPNITDASLTLFKNHKHLRFVHSGGSSGITQQGLAALSRTVPTLRADPPPGYGDRAFPLIGANR